MNIKKIAILLGLTLCKVTANTNQEIEVDLTDQKIYLFENGKNILIGRISSGRQGKETPTGTFKITQKEKNHVSNLWPKPNGGAKMHNMMRLGWSAIALHSGRLPGYPASHGCIRVEPKVADEMFKIVKIGTEVVVTGKAPQKNRVHKINKTENEISASFNALGYYPQDIPEISRDNW